MFTLHTFSLLVGDPESTTQLYCSPVPPKMLPDALSLRGLFAATLRPGAGPHLAKPTPHTALNSPSTRNLEEKKTGYRHALAPPTFERGHAPSALLACGHHHHRKHKKEQPQLPSSVNGWRQWRGMGGGDGRSRWRRWHTRSKRLAARGQQAPEGAHLSTLPVQQARRAPATVFSSHGERRVPPRPATHQRVPTHVEVGSGGCAHRSQRGRSATKEGP